MSNVGEMTQRSLPFVLIFLFSLLSFNTTPILGNSQQETTPEYFHITLLASTTNPIQVQTAQVINQELWKIGIGSTLELVSSDALLRGLLRGTPNENENKFGICFIEETIWNPVSSSLLHQTYHSSRNSQNNLLANFFPMNSSALDSVLERMQAELDFETRREYVRQALNIIAWEEHPMMGLYQPVTSFAIDPALRGFDAFRWGGSHIHAAELYYEYSDQTEFRFAIGTRFANLNPALSESYYDDIVCQPTQASTYQRNAKMVLEPVLAATPPIAIGSNDTIDSVIDISTISADSPYFGATTGSTWGPNPNVDSTQHNPYKTKAEKSMFLINLREDIPWHPGWGYELGERNVTVEDFQWTLSYLINSELGSPRAQTTLEIYGHEPTLALEKINATMFKLNLRGTLENGQVGDWFEACALGVLPQHVLDPAFDATPYGGGIGLTPDGTSIASYIDHREYAFNIGTKPLLGAGPYCFESWNEANLTATLRKFDHWAGYGETSLWPWYPYSKNNIETFSLIVYPSKETAELALEKDQIDGIDKQFRPYDFNIWGVPPYLAQLMLVETGEIQYMGFNTIHPKLSNRYVRLAISHLAPAQKIVDFILGGLASVNEVVGLPTFNPYYPSEEEWPTLGLSSFENVIDPDTGKELKFQGHIRYDIHKAWALMEKAGYSMDTLRDLIESDENEADGSNWGVQPGDTISWTFQKLKLPEDMDSDEWLSEELYLKEEGQEVHYERISLQEGSEISFKVVDANDSLWIRKTIDGIEGLTEEQRESYIWGLNLFIAPVDTDWSTFWIDDPLAIVRDDRSTFAATYGGPGRSWRIEYDKIDGTLRKLEWNSQINGELAEFVLIRSDLVKNYYLDLLFIKADTSDPVVIIFAALTAGACGTAVAQLLIMRRSKAQNCQIPTSHYPTPHYLAELMRQMRS
jgi:ABC-type transport system substrate-binding protein